MNPPDAAFVSRFKTALRDLLEEDYDDGAATQAAQDWWHTSQPGQTPEECAELEASEYGPE